MATPLEYFQWTAGTTLEVGVWVLALRRGLFRQLPLFTAYVSLLVTFEFTRLLAFRMVGLRSWGAFYLYWLTQAALLLARGTAVAEICARLLRPYAGIWKLCRGCLVGLAAFLVFSAAVTARGSASLIGPFVRTAERGLELTVVGVLLFALIFCRYFRIRVQPFIRLVALGLGLYSAVQVANNTILNQWLSGFLPWWKEIRTLTFNVTTVIWLMALWKPLPGPQQATALLDPEVYEELAPQMSIQLRQLNSRLEEMLK